MGILAGIIHLPVVVFREHSDYNCVIEIKK